MLKIISTILIVFALLYCISQPSHASDSFKSLSKSDFLTAYENKMEDAWVSYSVLYSRLDPELVDLVPGKEWTNEDRVVSACIYDKMVDLGKLDEYAAMIDNLDAMTALIESNENVTLFTLDEYEEIETATDIEGYSKAMVACGQMELMSKRMKESGLWEKIMAVGAAQAKGN